MTNNIVKVSIIIITYNHEKYIEQAVKSILSQKINFNYEVLIGEDASTDNTSNILRRLQKNLPKYFYIYYRENNLGMMANLYDLYNKANGKYIILLDGDDYWIYDLKLQKQVDFLEKHVDFIAVAHNTVVIDKEGSVREDYNYPECKNEEYSLLDFQKGILMGQTATVLYRNYRKYNLFKDLKISVNYPEDQRINFLLASNGRIKCFQEKWSAYRYVTDEGSSYTANVKYNKNRYVNRKIFLQEIKKYAFEINNNEAKKVAETKYLATSLLYALNNYIIDYTFLTWIKDFLKAKYNLNFIKFIYWKIRNIK